MLQRLAVRPAIGARITAGHVHPSFAHANVRFSSTGVRRPIAIAFDIDGVLKQGQVVLDEARRAIRRLEGENPWKQRVPYVFITNGGGKSEVARARDLSNDFGVEVTPSQVVQSHTVMQSLVNEYVDKPVLMVGGPDLPTGQSRSVFEGYGFRQVYTVHDLNAYAPASWPYAQPQEDQQSVVKRVDFSKIQLAAIFMFHDSRAWGRDIQIMLDVLRSDNGVFGTEITNDELRRRKQMPIFFSHGDLLWGNDHPVARLGQGAFRVALEAVYKEVTGLDLVSTIFGKPQRVTYDYADNRLQQLVQQQLGADQTPSVWMIGDNPASDIMGANGYGWSSALVRTGVFRDVAGPPAHEPSMIVDHVDQAIESIMQKEWA